MTQLIDIRPIDRRVYESRIRGFLPERIIDVHTHIWTEAAPPADGPVRTVTWPARVAAANPVEDLLETYRLMLPGKAVTPVLFGNPVSSDSLDRRNEYVREAARRHGLPALILSRPDWAAEEFERRIERDGFRGAKVYLTFAPAELSESQIRIFDFLPPHQLDVLHRRRWIVMLHLPRPGRLRDPANLEEMLRIERDWPDAQVIVAHVGRAYCDEDVGDAFEVLGATRRMSFDISANTNERVFGRLIAAVGPRRILFGSDMPILRMRMRRICEGGRYVNLVPRGLYGDVSGDPHMREADGEEAERMTFFLYEELDAFRRAAESAGLTRGDVEDVFYANAGRMLDRAARSCC